MSTTRRLIDRILAELRGSAGLDFERLLRSLGRSADAVLDALDPDTLAELMLDPDWKARLHEAAAELGGGGRRLSADEVKAKLEEAKRRRAEEARAHRERRRQEPGDAGSAGGRGAGGTRGGNAGRRSGSGAAGARPAPGDPWSVLGVPRDASRAECRAAFHRLAKRHHPDALGPDATAAARAEAERRMREINEAWGKLK